MSTKKAAASRKRWDSYEDYLKSSEWKKIRDAVIQRDDSMCVCCEDCSDLQVHHLEYSNDWNDDIPANCITLCKSCHESYHFHFQGNHIKVDSVDDFKKITSALIVAKEDGECLTSYSFLTIIANIVLKNQLECHVVDYPDQKHFIGGVEVDSFHYSIVTKSNLLMESKDAKK